MGKPGLVLVPGLICDERLFAPQVAGLRDLADIRVVTVGRAAGETMAAFAAEVLAAAPWPRFALGGLSMGGMVALAVAAAAPERVERLALMDTSHVAETAEKRAAREIRMRMAREGLLEQVLRDELAPAYLHPDNRTVATIDLVVDMGLSLGVDVYLRQCRAIMGRPDRTDLLRRFTKPALVACGRDDATTPLAAHEAMAALAPAAELAIIDGAGHLPTIERPDALNAALARWLARPLSSPSPPAERPA